MLLSTSDLFHLQHFTSSFHFNIIGVWVHFDEFLFEQYGIVLEYFYKHALRWAYEPKDNLLRREANKQVHEQHKMINMESFLGPLYLWPCSSTIRLPLPLSHLQRIIPYALSEWNFIKGGSDTVTELLGLNTCDPPCATTQSRAVTMMILLGAVMIHQLNHFLTVKYDLDSYPSLKHFRNAACKRSSYHKTLLQIVHAIKCRSAPHQFLHRCHIQILLHQLPREFSPEETTH